MFMCNKMRILRFISKTNYQAIHIILCHFDPKINLCIPKMPGRTVTELHTV